jgi:putative heme-binding domain-containing protein
MLSNLESGPETCRMALKDRDPNIRITALRALRALRGGVDVEFAVGQLVKDPSPQVRRECAITIRELGTSKCADWWASLAKQYDGKDRWYLEALGIGAAFNWDSYLAAWRQADSRMIRTKAGRDIVWRSRGKETAQMLGEFIEDHSVPTAELPRFFRAFDFLPSAIKDPVIANLAFSRPSPDPARAALVAAESINRLQGFDVSSQPEKKAALERVLTANAGTPQFVTLVDRFQLTDRYPEVLELALAQPAAQAGIDGMRLLIQKEQNERISAAVEDSHEPRVLAALQVLGNTADTRALVWLSPLVLNEERTDAVRQEAVRALVKMKPGAKELLKLSDDQKIPASLVQTVAAALYGSPFDDVRKGAAKRFPLPPSRNDQPLPPLAELLQAKGNIDAGHKVYSTLGKCATCHIVGKEGKDIGPNLSEIGSKLSREALFESILFPSAGISHNYETWSLATEDGNVVTGILISQTPESVSLKNAEGLVREIKKSEIDGELKKQSVSLMPADLQKTMTAEELIDVVEYLQTLRKK